MVKVPAWLMDRCSSVETGDGWSSQGLFVKVRISELKRPAA